MSTDPSGRQRGTTDPSDPGPVAGAEPDDSESTALSLRAILVAAGLFLVVGGLFVWLAPRSMFAQLLAAIEGAERNSRWMLAGGIVLAAFLSRFVLDSVPEHPIPPARVTTRAVEQSDRQLAVQPGVDIDNRLREILADQETYERRRAELTADLREIAIGTLCYANGVDRERAIEQLESGEWTDNRLAGALFKDRTDVSFRVRFERWLSPRKTYRREVGAAVDEICSQVDT